MTNADKGAIVTMARLCRELEQFDDPGYREHWIGLQTLHHAIRHLAYPDRDIYPKTRRATKGAPIVRK